MYIYTCMGHHFLPEAVARILQFKAIKVTCAQINGTESRLVLCQHLFPGGLGWRLCTKRFHAGKRRTCTFTSLNRTVGNSLQRLLPGGV